jgi:aryl-alcohol dehydrogenase-like predicted oxidoreductase
MTNMNLKKKIILGTAQFSNDYGISNNGKKINTSKLFKFAKKNMQYIDISNKYFKSNKVPNYIKKNKLKKCIKINFLEKKNFIKEINAQIKNFNNIYCVLIHNPNDLYNKKIKNIINYLLFLKKSKKIKKIGSSIYTVSDFEQTLKVFDNRPDIIQLPISIIDRTFLNKKIVSVIKKNKIEIHARSIFLQGLLLINKNNRNSYFAKWNYLFKKWDKMQSIQKKITCCIKFIKNIDFVKFIVVGFINKEQLSLFFNCLNQNVNINKLMKFKSNDKKLINPTEWKLQK